MIKDIGRKRAICILGTHRSGTSTITRGLNLLGVYLGEEKDLMKPLPENPEGFWERLDIYHIQERLLAILKRDWSTTAPLPENWHTVDEIRLLKNELAELVKRDFGGRPLWLWKDPRTCLLLPLWREVLSDAGIDLQIVFVVRNPIDVARSLEKRNGFTFDKGLGIWFNNTISALNGCIGLKTVFMSYDLFLDNWETELKKCAAELDIQWPANEAELRSKMASFMRPDLRHSITGLVELHDMKVPEPVIRLFGLLLEGPAEENLNSTESMITGIYKEFLNYARFFEVDIEMLADYRLRFVEMATSPESHPTLVEMRKELISRTEWAWMLDENLKLEKELNASLQNSFSWKITKPIRYVHGLFLKVWNDIYDKKQT